MSPASTLALGGLLAAILLFVVAALLWQEAKRKARSEAPAYVIEDAVSFIVDWLGQKTTLNRADVKRIIEWEVFYLQGLAQEKRWKPVDTVAGGHAPAIDFVSAQIAERHGAVYPRDEIRQVLEGEAHYLVSIGAVGDAVDGGSALQEEEGEQS